MGRIITEKESEFLSPVLRAVIEAATAVLSLKGDGIFNEEREEQLREGLRACSQLSMAFGEIPTDHVNVEAIAPAVTIRRLLKNVPAERQQYLKEELKLTEREFHVCLKPVELGGTLFFDEDRILLFLLEYAKLLLSVG